VLVRQLEMSAICSSVAPALLLPAAFMSLQKPQPT
jgi:hypothetical protein